MSVDLPTSWEQLGCLMGRHYLNYSFTKGSAQEVRFLIGACGLQPSQRLLDVGCGPGRHLAQWRHHGIASVGVDLSEDFVRIATDDGATTVVGDARKLPFGRHFDVAVALCQGGIGSLMDPGSDVDVLREMARVVKPGGWVVVTGFSAYFQVRWLEESDTFDAGSGSNDETTSVVTDLGPVGVQLRTSCVTPRELRLMAELCGCTEPTIYSVDPGRYRAAPPSIDSTEFLMLARIP